MQEYEYYIKNPITFKVRGWIYILNLSAHPVKTKTGKFWLNDRTIRSKSSTQIGVNLFDLPRTFCDDVTIPFAKLKRICLIQFLFHKSKLTFYIVTIYSVEYSSWVHIKIQVNFSLSQYSFKTNNNFRSPKN